MEDWLAWLRGKRQAMEAAAYQEALHALVGPPPTAEQLQFSSETVEVEELISVNEEIVDFAAAKR